MNTIDMGEPAFWFPLNQKAKHLNGAGFGER